MSEHAERSSYGAVGAQMTDDSKAASVKFSVGGAVTSTSKLDPELPSGSGLGATEWCGEEELLTDSPTLHDHKLTWHQLVFIAYSIVASGPFGLEAVAQSVGPFYGALAMLTIPIIYVLPQIIVVGELATMMPSPHGSVLWVERAFGTHVGFFNAVVVTLTNLVDAAVYPALFASYLVAAVHPEATYMQKVAFSWVCIVVGTCMCLLPAKWVGYAASVFSVSVMAPFVVGSIAGAKYLNAGALFETRSIYNDGTYDIGLLLSTLIWLYTGWQSLGCMAEEVRTPRDYFIGLPLALLLGVISYFFPLIVALCVPVPADLAKDLVWDTGYLSRAFDEVMHGLGLAIAVAGALSNVSLFASCILCYSRSLWGMAERGWAPSVLLRRHRRSKAPYVSVAVHVVACFALTLLDFNVLVRIEGAVAAVTYVLALLALAQLRRKEPNTHRPIKFPKNKVGSYFLVAVPTCVFLAVFVSSISSLWIFGTAVGILSGLAILTFLFRRQIVNQTNFDSPVASPVDVVRAATRRSIQDDGGSRDETVEMEASRSRDVSELLPPIAENL